MTKRKRAAKRKCGYCQKLTDNERQEEAARNYARGVESGKREVTRALLDALDIEAIVAGAIETHVAMYHDDD